MRNILLLALLPLVLLACDEEKPKSDASKPAASGSSSAKNAPAGSAASSATTPASVAAPSGPKPLFHTAGFQTPESVLYDDVNDRYLVSNVNGTPFAADNNGYITVLGTDGTVATEKWIEGGKNKVTLNAPKGSAIDSGVLYVADIDTVRMFDLKTGEAKGNIKIAGSSFLNDIAVNPMDNKIYVSDSGLKMGATAPGTSGTDAVYVIEKGKVRPLIKDSKKLDRPNGLALGPTGVWVVTYGADQLYRLDDKGQQQNAIKLPMGQLDGLVVYGETLFIASWDANAIYQGKTTGPFTVAFSNVKSPADIGFDSKRSRLLVPLFTENVVEAYDLKQ
jgi:sugar lactone lactonase YvrE